MFAHMPHGDRMSSTDEQTNRHGKSEAERIAALEQWRRGVDTDLSRGNDMMHDLQKEIHLQGLRIERIDGKASLAVAVIGFVAVAVIGLLVTQLLDKPEPQPITVELVMPNDAKN